MAVLVDSGKEGVEMPKDILHHGRGGGGLRVLPRKVGKVRR